MATIVKKKPGQSDDRLIADFRKKILVDEVLIELRERERYKKPAEIKKEKKKLWRKGKRRIV